MLMATNNAKLKIHTSCQVTKTNHSYLSYMSQQMHLLYYNTNFSVNY
jgi:hypothetical protein